MNIQISNSCEKSENCVHYIYIFAWSKVATVPLSQAVLSTPCCPILGLPLSLLTRPAPVGCKCDPCFSICFITYRSKRRWLVSMSASPL